MSLWQFLAANDGFTMFNGGKKKENNNYPTEDQFDHIMAELFEQGIIE